MKNLFILSHFFFSIWQPKKTLQTKFITDKIEIDARKVFEVKAAIALIL
jgi:hypothetical protein